MELIDSHLDLTDSFLGNSVFSESSQLLQSRLSSGDMEKMERNNLLLKLLELCQALDNTEKENQLLRIQKAQLHNQLKTTKSKAQQFIQSNIIAAQSLTSSPTNKFFQSVPRSPPKTSENGCFMTSYESSEDFQNTHLTNKVLTNAHNRATSNNCIISDHESLGGKKKFWNTLVNSPVKEVSIRMEASKGTRQNSVNKLNFPKNKIDALVMMEREYEQRNEEPENRTLQNFESFYCHKKDDFNETQRRGTYQTTFPKKPQSIGKSTYNQHKIYQPFLQQPSKNYSEQQNSDRQKGLNSNRSMSSSNLSNKDYCNPRGFKIPSSIDEIWGGSANQGYIDRTNNKTTRLTKVNANKTSLQRKSYLNF